MTWTDGNNSDITKYVGDSTINAYIFSKPTLASTNPICIIGTNTLTIINKSPASLTYGI